VQEWFPADNEGDSFLAHMDRENIRENFGGKAWGVAALLLVLLNGIVLMVSVQVLGSSGINLHFAYRDRVPRSANIYMATLACSLLAPIIVGTVGLFVDKRKTVAGWALAACALVFVLYGCAAE
jgi:hypothetical protein